MARRAANGGRDVSFECPVCRKRYTKKEHLQRHERTHTGDKPFRCPTCERNFARGDVLTRHMKSHRLAGQSNMERNLSPTSQGTSQPSVDQNGMHPAGVLLHSPTSGETAGDLSANPSTQLPIHSADGFGAEISGLDMSTLIWPDSEEFLRNIMSFDTMTWDNGMLGSAPTPPGPFDTLRIQTTNMTKYSPADQSSPAEDGHRAVQAVSGLITSTV
jgi:hypothetical protein